MTDQRPRTGRPDDRGRPTTRDARRTAGRAADARAPTSRPAVAPGRWATAAEPRAAGPSPLRRRSPSLVVASAPRPSSLPSTGASPTPTVARLRAGGHDHVRRVPPRPARRPARRRSASSSRIPGLRRPGRARHQARRGPRPARRRGHRRQADATRADIKPWFGGELAFSVGPLPDPAASSTGPIGAADVPRPRARLGQGRGARRRPGSTTRSPQAARTTRPRRPTTASTLTVVRAGAAAARPPSPSSTARSRSPATSPRSRPRSTPRAPAGSRPSPVQGGPRRRDRRPRRLHLRRAAAAPRLVRRSSTTAGAGAAAWPARRSTDDSDARPGLDGVRLRVEGDALRHGGASPPTAETRSARPTNRTSIVAEHVPATAIVAGRSATTTARRSSSRRSTSTRAEPSLKEVIDAARPGRSASLGGADAALGWIGDTGVVVERHRRRRRGRPRHRPDRRGRRAKRASRALKNLVALGGGRPGITVRDEDYNGTTITIIDLGDSSDSPGRPMGAGAPGARRCRAATSSSPTPSPTTSSSSASGPASSSTSSTPPPASRSPTTDRYKALVGRVGERHGQRVRRHHGDPRDDRGLPSPSADAERSSRVRDRRQAVPRARSMRSSRRASVEGDLDQLDRHHHRQVAAGRPRHHAAQRRNRTSPWQSASG